MTAKRVLKLRPGHDRTVDWLLLDTDGTLEAAGQSPAASAPDPDNQREAVALVPTEDVLLTSALVPTRNRQKLLQALPYALEDQLSGDIETLHFVPGERTKDGACTVAVVNRARMETWLETLGTAALQPQRMLPDALALPLVENTWSALLDGDRFVVRTGPASGFAGEIENFTLLLAASLREAGESAPSQLIVGGDTPPADTGEIPVPVVPAEAEAADFLARGLTQARGSLSLLTGPYRPARETHGRWRPWAVAIGLAVALVVLDGAQVLAERWQLAGERAALEEETDALFREIFPDAERMVAQRERVENELERLRGGEAGGDRLLDTLLVVGPHLRDASELELRGLLWSDQGLELRLEAESLQRLDALQQSLNSESGLRAEIRRANSEDDRVRGQLRIERVTS